MITIHGARGHAAKIDEACMRAREKKTSAFDGQLAKQNSILIKVLTPL